MNKQRRPDARKEVSTMYILALTPGELRTLVDFLETVLPEMRARLGPLFGDRLFVILEKCKTLQSKA